MHMPTGTGQAIQKKKDVQRESYLVHETVHNLQQRLCMLQEHACYPKEAHHM